MRVIKRTFVLCLAVGMLLVSGCGGTAYSETERSPDLLQESIEKKTTYRLHTAEPQWIGRDVEFTANPAYFLQKSIRTDAEYQLKELCVDRNQSVKAGDVIAVLQGQGSLMDVEQKRLEMNAYAAGAAEMENYYKGLIAAAEALPAETEADRELRSLRVSYAEMDYELYKLQASYAIETMENAISDMEAAAGEVYLYAPVDGSIRTLTTKYKDGDLVTAGTELCVINEADSERIYGTSSNGTFVYGREVQVTVGRGDKKKTYTGRVVSSPEVQPGDYYSNDIYIRLDETLNVRTTDSKATVSYTVLDNMLAVPSNAVTVQDGHATVQILDGDTFRTRGIVRGPIVGTTVTVLQGLKEGDQVVVSSYNS